MYPLRSIPRKLEANMSKTKISLSMKELILMEKQEGEIVKGEVFGRVTSHNEIIATQFNELIRKNN